MAQVSPLAREIMFKVVYYGPGLGGKTTSLQHVFATTKPEHRGKMVSLATPVDRTLYFDFLPIRIPARRDMNIRLQLFTVPGQVYYNATRRLVLTGADGVVFVADSQEDRRDANIESLRNLEENLLEHGRGLDDFPHVFAYNKRDLNQVSPIEDMERLLNVHGAPSFATVATGGEGVYEALEAITRAVLEDFEQRMPEHRALAQSSLVMPEGGLAEALRMVEQDGSGTARMELEGPESGESAFVMDEELLMDSRPFNEALGEEAARQMLEPGTRPGLGSALMEPPIELRRRKSSNPEPPSSPRAYPTEPPPFPKAGATMPPPLPNAGTTESMLSPAASESEPTESQAPSSRIPVPASLDGIGMRSTPPSAPPPPEPEASEPQGATAAPFGRGPDEPLAQEVLGCSLALLWPDDERDVVVQIEHAIAKGETRDSTVLCSALLQRCIENLASQVGRPNLETHAALMMLGMEGASYVEFLQSSLRARVRGQGIERAEALKLLLFVTNCHLARARITQD